MTAAPIDGFGHEALAALSAQRALETLASEPGAEGALLASLLSSDGLWRVSPAWLESWCRQIEKALTR